MSTINASRRHESRGRPARKDGKVTKKVAGVREILTVPMDVPTAKDFQHPTVEEGRYNFYIKRNKGMPKSSYRPEGLTRDLGSLEDGIPDGQLKKAKAAIKYRVNMLEENESVVASDKIVNFFKDLKIAPRISHLQPGSEIMSACKIKAEFWLLHLDVRTRNRLHALVKKICKETPCHKNGSTVGLTVPFKFKDNPDLTAPFNSTVGLMSIEPAKMKWKIDSSDMSKSNTVVEISMFETDTQLFGDEADKVTDDEHEDIKIEAVSDMGQFVKHSLTYINRMSKEEVETLLEQYGFRSHLLSLMNMNGVQLMHMLGKNQDMDKLSRILSISPPELRRLLYIVNMISRRATPEKYSERLSKSKSSRTREKIMKKMRNTAEIEILPMWKPVQVRCDRALCLETEIRATAECVIRRVLDEKKKDYSITRTLDVSGINKQWKEARDQEVFELMSKATA